MNEFKIKNGLLVSGSITGVTESLSDDSGKMASTGWIRSYLSTNGYLTSVTSSAVTTALGYTPYNASNPSGYISGITSSMVTTALGFTPYNATNPNGYITSSALSSYLPLSGGTLTGALTIGNFDGQSLKFQSGTSTGSTYLRFYNSVGASRGYLGLFWSGAADYMVLDAGALEMNFGSSNKFTFTGGGPAIFSGALTTNSDVTISTGSIKLYSVQNAAGQYRYIGTEYAAGNGNNKAEIRFGIDGADTKTKITLHTANGGGQINEVLGVYATGQLKLNNYSTSTSFSGTATGYLAFDSSGNVITVAGVSGTDNTKLPLAGGTMTGQITSSSIAPLSFTYGSNTGTYNQTVIYANQNNTSGDTANGIFIERGRLTDSASAEVRYFVIGARGGAIQWRIDGSGNVWQLGSLSINGNTAWHAGNLTNLNQLSNGPGYITSSATITGAAARISSRDNRTIAPNSDTAAELRFGFTSWNNNNTSPWADYIHLRSYSDSSGGSDNLITFLKSGIGMRIWQQSWGSATAYSSYVDVLHSGNYTSYSPTLTGGGASGTWGINVTGSSRTLLFSGDSAKAFLDGLWAGGGSYPGYQFTGGNSRFGFSSTSGVVDVYADGNFYATDSSYLVLHTGNIGSYTSGNSNQLNGLSSTQLFNNMGQAHGAYTDANSVGGFGFRYIQGSTNSPNTGASQYYGLTIGLGDQYAFGTYGSQLYWNRVATGGNPYISVRFQEGGAWSSWSKIYAGYADTAGTATNITQYVINQNLSTGADVTHSILRASSYVVTPTIYSGGGNITLGNNVANMTIAPSSASWAEGLSFTMPTSSTWGGLRWRRERGNADGNWYVGFTALDSSDDLVFGANNGGSQVDNIIRLSKSGIVSAKYGYVSYGNPWGTSDSAFFPNGITTAGNTNWIYGTTFLGNAPGNGAGHQFWSDGIQYSTQRVSIGTNDTSRSYWDGRSSRAGLLITGVPYPAIHVDATDNNNTTHGAVISLTGGLSSGGYRRWGMGIANRDPSIFSIGWYDNQSNPHYGVGTGWSYPARLSLDTSGNLVVSGDITAYGSLSDINLKTIKEKVPNALDGLMKLSGYRFDWKEDKNRLLNIKEDIGVIAQEVEQVFPELARTGDNGNMSVRYQGLTAVLIEAVKEQQAQIEELKNLIKELSAK